MEETPKRVLLVIDVQMDYFSGPMTVTYPQDSFQRILQAVEAAHAARVPVVMIQHAASRPTLKLFVKGTEGWQIHPELVRRGWDHLIEKTFAGSFTGTGLDEWLRAHGIGTVAICGYMTQMCCDTTARQAQHLGYAVEFLGDATGTLDFSNDAGSVKAEELYRAVLVTQNWGFSRVMTVEQWAARLE
jgi:nicotinamidase-related amidase